MGQNIVIEIRCWRENNFSFYYFHVHWSEPVCSSTFPGVRHDGPPQRFHDPHAPRSQLWYLQVPLQLELPQLSEHPEGRVPPGPVQEIWLSCSQVPHRPEEHLKTRTAQSQWNRHALSSRSSDMYWHDSAPYRHRARIWRESFTAPSNIGGLLCINSPVDSTSRWQRTRCKEENSRTGWPQIPWMLNLLDWKEQTHRG